MQPDQAPATSVIEIARGRKLEVLVTGPDDGLPLVFHNGTPGGLVAFGPMTAAAADRGLRTIMYARPGYGASTAVPDRRVADAADDVAALLDRLGAGQFVTCGWSGGGPHSLACAAMLPGRCLAAATIAGVAPYTAGGLDWLGGMGDENVHEFGEALAGESELTDYLATEADALREVTADQVAEGLGGLASDVDKSVITGEFAGYLAESFRAGVRPGIEGWRDDDLAFVSGWGFALESPVPVSVWQGGQDMMVPLAHGQWLAAHWQGAKAHLMPGEGHLSLAVAKFGDILDDLLSSAGVR
jgi:pimeloyl-ACP methyl ester carboxylesterase